MTTAFGATAVGVMFVAYWLEPRSRWYVVLFAAGCAAASAYAWFIGSYPFFVIEGLWSAVAFRRFWLRYRAESQTSHVHKEAHAV